MSICFNFFCDPVKLPCEHAFCRLCIIACLQKAPDGLHCAVCRSDVGNFNPFTAAVDVELDQRVDAKSSKEENERRSVTSSSICNQLSAQEGTYLPVFCMTPSPIVGSSVCLTLSEDRYRLLAERAWRSTRRTFVYFAGTHPEEGQRAVIVKIEKAHFGSSGRVQITGHVTQRCILGCTHQDEKSEGLWCVQLPLF